MTCLQNSSGIIQGRKLMLPIKTTDNVVNLLTARLLVLSCGCFIAAACIGLVASANVAFPDLFFNSASFTKLRPMHTFLAFSGILSGMMALLNAIIGSDKRQATGSMHKGAIQFGLILVFALAGTVTLALGYGSGREYISWSPLLSVFLISAIIIATYNLFSRTSLR